VEPGAGPDRKRYAITAEGSTDLESWLSEPEDPRPDLQPVLFTKVVLALLCGRPAEAFLNAQRERHLAAMRELTTARRTAPIQEGLLADYHLFHLEADLRWIDHAVARLAAWARAIAS